MNTTRARYHFAMRSFVPRVLVLTFFHAVVLFQPCFALDSTSVASENQFREPQPDSSNVIVKDILAVAQDARLLVRTTGSFGMRSITNNSYLYAGGIAAELGLIFGGGDTVVQNMMQRNQQPSTERYIKFFNTYGEIYAAAGIVGGMYITGLATESPSLRTAARKAGETLVLAGVTTTVLKAVVGRARPYTQMGSTAVTPFAFEEDNYSWPSGHTTVAFSLSSSLARSIDNVYVSALLYAGAAGTGIARMYYDKHWLSDVLAGAAIGTLSAQLIHSLDDRNATSERNGSSSSVGSMLMIGPTPGGISICYAW